MAADSNADVAEQIIELLAKKTGIPKDRVRSADRLLHDLRLYGDDAEEVVLAIADSFKLDASKFPFQEYFVSEVSALWMLPTLLRRRILWGKKYLTVADLIRSVEAGTWPDPTRAPVE